MSEETISDWVDCKVCGNTHESMTACPSPLIRQPDEERTPEQIESDEQCRREFQTRASEWNNPVNIPALQSKELRQAFHAGAMVALGLLSENANKLTEAEAAKAMQALYQESVKAGEEIIAVNDARN